MKMSNFKKLLFTLALVIVVQNGVVIAANQPEETYAGEESVSPCSDLPLKDSVVD